jgi:hypothetical protein
VVVATYNRSNALRYSLECLVAQTVEEWEALVIGDRCTDDTSEVVASFDDPRIRWLNLERNMGEQSGPNSIGGRLARGEYVAWLNHDDLWFPEHLADLIRTATAGHADVVASGVIVVGPGGAGDPLGLWAERWNATPSTGLRLANFYPASTWLVRRDLARRLGDWRPAASLRAASSQDYLFRCWVSGARMRMGGTPSVVAIQSGRFPRAYAERRIHEHEVVAPLVAERSPLEVVERLEALPGSPDLPVAGRLRMALGQGTFPRAAAREVALATVVPLAARLGVSPRELKSWVAGRRRGQWVADLRRARGLDDQ